MQLNNRLKKLEAMRTPPTDKKPWWEELAERWAECPHDDLKQTARDPYVFCSPRTDLPKPFVESGQVISHSKRIGKAAHYHCHQCGMQDFLFDVSGLTSEELLWFGHVRNNGGHESGDITQKLIEDGYVDFVPFTESQRGRWVVADAAREYRSEL